MNLSSSHLSVEKASKSMWTWRQVTKLCPVTLLENLSSLFFPQLFLTLVSYSCSQMEGVLSVLLSPFSLSQEKVIDEGSSLCITMIRCLQSTLHSVVDTRHLGRDIWDKCRGPWHKLTVGVVWILSPKAAPTVNIWSLPSRHLIRDPSTPVLSFGCS